jgi:mannose-6-phosphate isomerase-like protein (cupin superfamily)
MDDEAFDLSKTFIHLGLKSSAVPLPGFQFSKDYLRKYLVRFATDRYEGRLVGMLPMDRTWTHWERHLGGEEVVVVVSGRCDVIQDLGDEGFRTIPMGPGEAMINPKGVWHTTDVHEPGTQLFIAAGRQTVYRLRDVAAPR